MNSIGHSRLAGTVLAGFRACLITVAIGLLLMGATAAFAQSIFANLSGTVTDPSGAVVAGAKVSVEDSATKVVRQFVTNDTGYFSATQLSTGTYNVSVDAKNFKKWQGKGIVLNSSDNKTLSIGLQVGTEGETVEVIGTGEIAVTDTGEKSSSISSEQLEKLSLVGRNATEYLKILPGASLSANGGVNRLGYTGEVVGINGFSVGGSAGGLGGVVINGQTTTGVSINQDGQNVQDPGAPGSATPVNPNPDMISEVKVLTSNYGADSAKGPILINTITKGGTQSFHGDVHFYARHSAMNSEDAFNKAIEADPGSGFSKGQLKIPSHYYYPGFNFGGPVIIPGTEFNKSRKKYFFHESFENYRQLIDGGVDRAFVPTADMLNGDFSAMSTWAHSPGRFGMSNIPSGTVSDLRPGCTITNGVLSPECISSLAKQYMTNALPAATSAEPDSHGFNYIAPVQEQQNSTQNVVRGDMNFTENTKVYVSWSRQRETANMPLGLWNNPGDWVIPAPSASIGANTSDFYAVNFLHLFSPTLTVEARFGYTHIDFPTTPSDPSKVLRSEMNFPQKGVFANPNAPVALSWGQSIPTLGDIGHDYHPTMIAKKGIPSSGADVTKVFRTHTVKAGFFWEHGYNKQDNWGQYMGVYTYSPWCCQVSGNNYADMLMGVGFSGYGEQALPPALNSAANNMSFYATDHWKINRRITVDYGLRFEHYGAPYPDTRFGVAIFDKNKYQNGVQNSGISWHSLDHSIPISGVSGQPVLFSPRFGAAFDLFGNGKTVIRGGWGQFRYGNYVGAASGPAATALGSTFWSCGSSDDCRTWEQIDNHINDGSGGTNPCAAGANCAPTVVYGQETDFTNTSPTVIDPHNHTTSRTTSYSLNIDQQLPGKFMFELSYVGNHTDFRQNSLNINSVPVGAMTPAQVAIVCADNPDPTNGTCQQKFRPYSNYTGMSATESAGKDQYDALQTSLTRSSGLVTVSLNYTFAKSFTNSNTSGAFKDYGVHEYWSISNFNRAHVFNAAYVFSVPKFSTDNRILRGAANGWEISGITQVESGAQLTANAGGSNFGINGADSAVNLSGSPDVTVFSALTCSPSQGTKHNQFANPLCFALPESGTIGSARFPYLPGPMFWNSDLTLVKHFKLTEHQNLEFRFAAFNFLNHALLSFTNGDNNAKLNFNDMNQVITGSRMVYPGNGVDTQPQLMDCQAKTIDQTINGVNYPDGIRCSGDSTFGVATSHYGHRILSFGVKYSF